MNSRERRQQRGEELAANELAEADCDAHAQQQRGVKPAAIELVEAGGDALNDYAAREEAFVDWQPGRSRSVRCGCSDHCLNTTVPFVGNVLEWFDFSVFGCVPSRNMLWPL